MERGSELGVKYVLGVDPGLLLGTVSLPVHEILENPASAPRVQDLVDSVNVLSFSY
jgi:hypothetical protein